MLLKKIIFAVLLGITLPAIVQADSLLPELPKAKKNYNDETLCVEPVDVMRKDHMSFILHQRDDTMRRGVRTKQHSLKECIDCHNAPAEDGKVASSDSAEHFCSTCHTYVAVQIDCFTCHSDKPENTQYRHKLSAQSMKYHMDLAAKELNTDMLNLLAKEQDGQQ